VVSTGGNANYLQGEESDEIPVVPVPEVDPDEVYPVAALMAPVFDARGKVSFALVLAGFQAPMTGAQALTAGARLREACARISGFVGGRERT
jgi:hypothetical protein